jgi:DNA-binding transcriptional MerR regulator
MANRLDTTPNYNIKAVAHETGLKPDTLRAWERRYGLPNPARSQGGHRLYSQRDIEIFKWLKARQLEGLSISRAVKLWRQMEREGQDPLRMQPYVQQQPDEIPMGGNEIGMLREAWIEACKAFDERSAERILNQAFAIHPPEVVCLEIITTGLSTIGREWFRGKVIVQQEHFASELAIRQLENLIAATPNPTLPGKILVICPPLEEHTFSGLLITFLLRRNGRDTIFLGANVPLLRLDSTLQSIEPMLVILTAQRLVTAANLKQMASQLADREILTAYGGRIFNIEPKTRDHIQGVFLGERIDEVPSVVESLLSSTPLVAQAKALHPDYIQTIEKFHLHQAEVENTVISEMITNAISIYPIRISNLNLSTNIIASLEMGDIGLLRSDIEWVRGFLEYQKIPPETLDHYLVVYENAIKDVLGEDGKPITDFFARFAREK